MVAFSLLIEQFPWEDFSQFGKAQHQGRFALYSYNWATTKHGVPSMPKSLRIAKTGGSQWVNRRYSFFLKSYEKPSKNPLLQSYNLLQCCQLLAENFIQVMCTGWDFSGGRGRSRFWPNESASQCWSVISTYLAEGFQIGWLCQIGCSLYDNNLCMVPTLKQKESRY